MKTSFEHVLMEGDKTNSLGRAEEVVQEVLADHSRLDELYNCLFESDAWLRMRAADSLEKVCRVHPEWLEPYVNRLIQDVGKSEQPSLQWHLAQIFAQVALTPSQQSQVVDWLKARLKDKNIDWIVAANAMTALAQFAKAKAIAKPEAIALIRSQEQHRSASVRKRAAKLLTELT